MTARAERLQVGYVIRTAMFHFDNVIDLHATLVKHTLSRFGPPERTHVVLAPRCKVERMIRAVRPFRQLFANAS